MSEDVLIPKMKRIDKKQRKIKIPILNFVLILFCTLMLVASTFVNIELRHYVIPRDNNYIFTFNIIPQIPILMFVCAILGKKQAITSVFLYIILGLTLFPVFALGGGLHYVTEYSFGYILAYIPAVLISGQFLKLKYSWLNMFLASLFGVLIIHFCGIIYMIIIALIKHDGGTFIKGWIYAQSGLKIAYDIILSFVLILIGKYIHAFFKFIKD